MKYSELLRAAKNRIATEETWTVGVSARDAQGEPCEVEGEAVRWCAIGALKVPFANVLVDLLDEAALHLYNEDIAVVNDNTGLDAVHKVYDLAIETAEREEKR